MLLPEILTLLDYRFLSKAAAKRDQAGNETRSEIRLLGSTVSEGYDNNAWACLAATRQLVLLIPRLQRDSGYHHHDRGTSSQKPTMTTDRQGQILLPLWILLRKHTQKIICCANKSNLLQSSYSFWWMNDSLFWRCSLCTTLFSCCGVESGEKGLVRHFARKHIIRQIMPRHRSTCMTLTARCIILYKHLSPASFYYILPHGNKNNVIFT